MRIFYFLLNCKRLMTVYCMNIYVKKYAFVTLKYFEEWFEHDRCGSVVDDVHNAFVACTKVMTKILISLFPEYILCTKRKKEHQEADLQIQGNKLCDAI